MLINAFYLMVRRGQLLLVKKASKIYEKPALLLNLDPLGLCYDLSRNFPDKVLDSVASLT